MKAVLVGFAASALLLAGGQADEAALKKEKASLEGMWKITRFETPKGVEDKLVGSVLVLKKDGTLELQKDGDTKKGTFKINPAAKPKEIDIIPDGKDLAMKGIYRLEKDTLTICLDDDTENGQRPKEFAVPEATKHVLVTLERSK